MTIPHPGWLRSVRLAPAWHQRTRRAGSRHWVSMLKCDVIESRRDKLLLVSDCCLYFSRELRGDLPNPMLLCVFRGVLQHFLFGVPPYYMCASGRWINLGALNDFPHGSSSLLSQDLPISDNCCENLVKLMSKRKANSEEIGGESQWLYMQ